ncbi:hypothetical protein G9A89_003367 [Geosiphon pyriformis]|nr:hypothetical protein G9A89_003367 [Geosiphon pyriformis]
METIEIKRTRPEAHDCNKCEECQKSIKNNKKNYCGACQVLFLEKLYKDFSSGNKVVDELIKNPIYTPKYNQKHHFEWIPWDRLKDINKIAKGEFGVIYKATWIDGLIDLNSIKHHGEMDYKRNKFTKEKEVTIKFINTSFQKNEELFKEINIQRAIFIESGKLSYTSLIIGITQNAETLEYGIVMELAESGDMRKFLSKNSHSNPRNNKLWTTKNIIKGLDRIHFKQSSEKNIKETAESDDTKKTLTKIHPNAVYTSRLLTLKMIEGSNGLFII